MENLITANIKSRPTRTFISVAAVALGVILLLVVGGIVKGTLDDYLGRTMSIGADFILQPPGGSILYAFSEPGLNEKYADMVREIPGVAAITPVLSKFSSKQFGLVFGIDWASYRQFPGRLEITEGKPGLQGDDVIVDQSYAAANNLTLGMKTELLGHEYTVSAICRPGAAVRIFTPLETFKVNTGTPDDKVTIMFIKAVPGADLEKVHAAISEKFPGFSILRTSDPKMLLAEAKMPGLGPFRMLIVLVSMLLSFMIILLAMYTTIFERTREIGILKSLGASQRFIVGMILKESAMICSLGVIFGIVVSEIVRIVIVAKFPTLQVSMTAGDLSKGLVLGLLAGVLGALYPAYKAARMDPVKALSYE
ncbi:MAG: ABC transporter permease [Acidobacteriota bacterium]|jgi:putative ABC transport system permease protein|nr:ABC transporter permease [Acidobacteriota bacterium]